MRRANGHPAVEKPALDEPEVADQLIRVVIYQLIVSLGKGSRSPHRVVKPQKYPEVEKPMKDEHPAVKKPAEDEPKKVDQLIRVVNSRLIMSPDRGSRSPHSVVKPKKKRLQVPTIISCKYHKKKAENTTKNSTKCKTRGTLSFKLTQMDKYLRQTRKRRIYTHTILVTQECLDNHNQRK